MHDIYSSSGSWCSALNPPPPSPPPSAGLSGEPSAVLFQRVIVKQVQQLCVSCSARFLDIYFLVCFFVTKNGDSTYLFRITHISLQHQVKSPMGAIGHFLTFKFIKCLFPQCHTLSHIDSHFSDKCSNFLC